MRHVGAIASRELRSFFVSPIAYVVLTLWAVLAGTLFLSSVLSFRYQLEQAQALQAMQFLNQLNLNDHLIRPFFEGMWIVLIFLVPGVTMGLFASEKANGTEELLLTSPITIWEIVLGKFLAGALFVALMTLLVAFYPAILFAYGDPETGKTAAGLLALLLVSLAYVSVGAFASAVTRNQLVAFILGMFLLLVLGLMLPVIVDVAFGGGGVGEGGGLAGAIQYMSTANHAENLLNGLVETKDLVYFGVAIGAFLLLSKAVIESVRWR